ncbi:MAG TPA: ATP-binding protein [Bacteroidales bacterium]|nr:ATP-binding protein [Bacteroidales bacterium]
MLQKKKVLGSVSLFRDCSRQMLDEIATSLEEIQFGSDQVVFNKGDRLQALYIIEGGKVKAHDGSYLFAEFGANQFFGEYSLIDSSIRSASVTTLEPTTLLRLEKNKFDKLIEQHPHFARGIMISLISRLRSNNVLEEELAQKSQELSREKEEIERRKSKLEKLNANKDKFFSIIAHDLKNPFNTIMGLSELLLYNLEHYPKEKIREFVTQIYNYSTHTYTLLDNLLQWARSQTQQMEVQPDFIDLEALIHDNINLLTNKAEEKNIALEADIDQEARQAFADENMINTVIRNLLSNAIKFTPDNGLVRIHTRSQHGEVVLSIIDNGVGISKENISKLFDLKTSYSTHGTHSEKGTGLGLLLCREFVQMNGGRIWVESEPGEGSTFSFSLSESNGST